MKTLSGMDSRVIGLKLAGSSVPSFFLMYQYGARLFPFGWNNTA